MIAKSNICTTCTAHLYNPNTEHPINIRVEGDESRLHIRSHAETNAPMKAQASGCMDASLSIFRPSGSVWLDCALMAGPVEQTTPLRIHRKTARLVKNRRKTACLRFFLLIQSVDRDGDTNAKLRSNASAP